MAWWVRVLAAKPDELSFILMNCLIRQKERTGFQKLSFGLHMCVVVPIYTRTHTHTNISIAKFFKMSSRKVWTI